MGLETIRARKLVEDTKKQIRNGVVTVSGDRVNVNKADAEKLSKYLGVKIEILQSKVCFGKLDHSDRDYYRGQLKALIDIEKALGVAKVERRVLWQK